jgi:hypothetical protein
MPFAMGAVLKTLKRNREMSAGLQRMAPAQQGSDLSDLSLADPSDFKFPVPSDSRVPLASANGQVALQWQSLCQWLRMWTAFGR